MLIKFIFFSRLGQPSGQGSTNTKQVTEGEGYPQPTLSQPNHEKIFKTFIFKSLSWSWFRIGRLRSF